MTSREVTTIHTGIDFGEGPRWHDGRLWFSDFYRHGVFTLDADGAIWMADVVNGQLCRVHEGGTISETIAVDGAAVACALGGHEGRTLFLMVSPGTQPSDVDGLGRSVIMATRVDAGAAGRP